MACVPHHVPERAQVVGARGAVAGHEGGLEKLEHPVVAGEDGHCGQVGLHVVQEVVLVLIDLEVAERLAEGDVADRVNAKVAGQVAPVHRPRPAVRGRNVLCADEVEQDGDLAVDATLDAVVLRVRVELGSEILAGCWTGWTQSPGRIGHVTYPWCHLLAQSLVLLVVRHAEKGVLVRHEPAALVPVGATPGATPRVDLANVVGIADQQSLRANPGKSAYAGEKKAQAVRITFAQHVKNREGRNGKAVQFETRRGFVNEPYLLLTSVKEMCMAPERMALSSQILENPTVGGPLKWRRRACWTKQCTT